MVNFSATILCRVQLSVVCHAPSVNMQYFQENAATNFRDNQPHFCA